MAEDIWKVLELRCCQTAISMSVFIFSLLLPKRHNVIFKQHNARWRDTTGDPEWTKVYVVLHFNSVQCMCIISGCCFCVQLTTSRTWPVVQSWYGLDTQRRTASQGCVTSRPTRMISRDEPLNVITRSAEFHFTLTTLVFLRPAETSDASLVSTTRKTCRERASYRAPITTSRMSLSVATTCRPFWWSAFAIPTKEYHVYKSFSTWCYWWHLTCDIYGLDIEATMQFLIIFILSLTTPNTFLNYSQCEV